MGHLTLLLILRIVEAIVARNYVRARTDSGRSARLGLEPKIFLSESSTLVIELAYYPSSDTDMAFVRESSN